MSTQIGMSADWLPTEWNIIADNISCLKHKQGGYDYSKILRDHTSLKLCCQFQASEILLGKICDILRNKDSMDPLILRKLEPQTLGSFIS